MCAGGVVLVSIVGGSSQIVEIMVASKQKRNGR